MILFLVLSAVSLALDQIEVNPIPSTFTPPQNRIYPFMDYSSTTKSLIIFGGSQGISTLFNDV